MTCINAICVFCCVTALRILPLVVALRILPLVVALRILSPCGPSLRGAKRRSNPGKP